MTTQQKTIQTPLAKLQHKKELIRLESTIQQQKLDQHLSYMKDNAGSLALSGLSSMLFSGSKSSSPKEEKKQPLLSTTASLPLGILKSLSYGKGLVPIVLEIAQPFLITWGLKTVKNLITGIFSKKKK